VSEQFSRDGRIIWAKGARGRWGTPVNSRTESGENHELVRNTDQAQGGVRYAGKPELQQAEALRNYNRFICRLFRREYEGGVILDFGAGIGTLTDQMADLGDIVCVEVDPEHSETLRAKGYEVLPSVELLKDETVSFAYSSNVLEHLDDDLGALRAIHRKLRPGGRLALFVPAFGCVWTALDERIGHKRRYTQEGLADIVAQSGFRVENTYYVDSIGFLLALLFRFVGSKDGSLNTAHLVIFDRVIFPISRAMDMICRRLFGKNVYLVARK
jgi:SAM-dependent methyltransferase